MSRRLGFNFRKACRKLNPELAAKLDRAAPLPRDPRRRLESIQGKIDDINWGRNPSRHADELAKLIDERNRIRDALKHQTARRVATEKRDGSGGKLG